MHTITTIGLDIAKSVFQVHTAGPQSRIERPGGPARRYQLEDGLPTCVSVHPPLCFLDQLDAQRSRRKKKVTPVTFPPGRARLATSPADEALLGTTAAAWPLAVRAQQSGPLRRIEGSFRLLFDVACTPTRVVTGRRRFWRSRGSGHVGRNGFGPIRRRSCDRRSSTFVGRRSHLRAISRRPFQCIPRHREVLSAARFVPNPVHAELRPVVASPNVRSLGP
jgi:hypothetical protein